MRKGIGGREVVGLCWRVEGKTQRLAWLRALAHGGQDWLRRQLGRRGAVRWNATSGNGSSASATMRWFVRTEWEITVTSRLGMWQPAQSSGGILCSRRDSGTAQLFS